jgi:hypothetical protein
MPCRDYYDDHPEQYFKDHTEPALKKQISFAESALCAALNALDYRRDTPSTETLDMIDYTQSGITRQELEAWRIKHAETDRRIREGKMAAARASALAKLTPLERKALGIK